MINVPSRDGRERWLLRWSRFTKCLYHVSACRSYRKVCCGGLDWSRAKPDTFLSTSMSGRSPYQGSGVGVISPSPARFPSSSRQLWKNCRSSCPRSCETVTPLTGDFEGVRTEASNKVRTGYADWRGMKDATRCRSNCLKPGYADLSDWRTSFSTACAA